MPHDADAVSIKTNQYAGESNDMARLIDQAGAIYAPFLAALREHGLADGQRVLDVGCGVGLLTRTIAEALPNTAVTGLDCDEHAIAKAQQMPGRQRFVLGDACALPFADGSFDFVSVSLVLMHLRDPAQAVRECVRVLAPGGVLCVMDTDDAAWVFDPPCYAFEELKAMLARWYTRTGGSRLMGRKLPRLLAGAGLTQVRYEVRAQSTLELGRERFNQTYLEIFRVQAPRFVQADPDAAGTVERLIATLDRAAEEDYFSAICGVFSSGRKPS